MSGVANLKLLRRHNPRRRAPQSRGKRKASETGGSSHKRTRDSIYAGKVVGFIVGAKVEMDQGVGYDPSLAASGEAFDTSPIEEMPRTSPVRASLPLSLGLDDLTGLMGQALEDLARNFYFDLPAKGTKSVSIPPFEFPSLSSPTSMLSVGDLSVDMYSVFSMGLAGAGALPATTSGGETPATDQEGVSILLPLPHLLAVRTILPLSRRGVDLR